MTKTIERPATRAKAMDQREAVGFLNNTIQFLSAKMEPMQPQLGTSVQFQLARKKSGEYAVVEVGQLVKPLVTKPARPGKLAPQYSTWPSADLLRSAFGGPGESAFDNCPDAALVKVTFFWG